MKKLKKLVGGYLFGLASVLLVINCVIIQDEEFYNILVLIALLLIPMGIPLMIAKQHPYIISVVLTLASLFMNFEFLFTGGLYFSVIIDIVIICSMIGLFYTEKRLGKKKSL